MINIEIHNYSRLDSKIFINDDQTILVGEFAGIYRNGSEGNSDGLFMLSKMVSAYFLFETIAVIIYDLRGLEYKWGNTLLKPLQIFEEIGRDEEETKKKIVIVSSPINNDPIRELLKMKINYEHLIYMDMDEAMSRAKIEVSKYFI